MGAVDFVIGWVILAVAVAALSLGAWRIRQRFLVGWSGAPARLAEIVVVLGLATFVSEVLGTVGLFERWPMLAAFVAVGLLVAYLCRPQAVPTRAPEFGASAPPASAVKRARTPRIMVVLTAIGIGVAATPWLQHTARAYRYGMEHADTLWYHGPIPVHIVQSGSTWAIPGGTDTTVSYYPAASELFHALLILPFHRDLLSPLVNLGWFAVALLAAWTIGRKVGAAPACTLGAAAVLSLPILAGSQAGQASSDIPAIALLLAAVAIIFERRPATATLAVGGVAAGLAAGSKLTVVAAVATITLGLLVEAVRRRRVVPLIAWSTTGVVAGGYWYLRNLVTVHNPLPGTPISVGPVHLPTVTGAPTCCSILRYTRDHPDRIRSLVTRTFGATLGHGWPLLLLLVAAGALLPLFFGRNATERAAGAAVLASAVAFLITPSTIAGFLGVSFYGNVRYVVPALLLGCVLLPQSRLLIARHRQWGCVAAFAVILGSSIVAPEYFHEPARWPAGHSVELALVLGGLVGIAAGFLWTAIGRARPMSGVVMGVIATAIVLGGLGLAFAGQRYYLDHRYAATDTAVGAAYSRFRSVHGARVALFGTFNEYPFFGADLSNSVERPLPPDRPLSTKATCVYWRAALRRGDFDYVVIDTELTPATRINPKILGGARGAERTFDSGLYRIYRITGPLDATSCGAART